ncbi:hypothetical protein QOT17_015864 [Balamuthia mandrillaris]
MAAVRLNQVVRLLSGSSDGNPFVRPLQRFLLFTQIANFLVVIGVVIGIILFKEDGERAAFGTALALCLLSVLLQLFYHHAAGSASGVKQALGLAFILVSLVLSVFGALGLLLYSLLYQLGHNLCLTDDRDARLECKERGAKVTERVHLLIAIGVPVFAAVCVIQVVLLVLWGKLINASRHKGRKHVLPVFNPEDGAAAQPFLKPFEQ